MLSLSKQLENFRERGEIPETLTRRFIKVLKAAERNRLAAMLRTKLNEALDGEATELEAAGVCARIIRVRNIRREKGELL